MKKVTEHRIKCANCGKEIDLDDKESFKTIMHHQMHRYVCNNNKCMYEFYGYKCTPMEVACFWEEVDDGECYESSCNKKEFQFNDGNPQDNGFEFCPYCGKKLIVKKPIFDEVGI